MCRKKNHYFYLLEDFEVCSMMDDVFMENRRNINGDVFGFVRFSNIRYVGKLTKAFDNVHFRTFRVFANVARFDRFENPKEVRVTGFLGG
jgi:hypothetical protein